MQKITINLWFDTQAEDAANFYVSVFKNAKILNASRYSEVGQEVHGQQPGSVMTIEFELDGQKFVGLNGGPVFTFSEAVSFVINCQGQEEVDYYWEKLSAVPESEQCGWLKDKFGVSWQVIPSELSELLSDSDSGRSQRAMMAMLQMKKIDIAGLQAAADGAA